MKAWIAISIAWYLLVGVPAVAQKPKYPRVVLILVDTLRADHLPFYGYHKDTAPFLSTLVSKSVLFENAISTSSYTAPATASVHTGLLPYEHGVVIGMNATKRLNKVNPAFKLNRVPQEAVTLAEYFKSLGYGTYGLADNGNIAKEMGFAQGFDKFVTFKNEGSKHINERALAWKEEILAQEKYFLYLHYMDPHSPYEKHAPWYDENAKGIKEKLISSYDSEINFVDQRIKELHHALNWGEDTLIIFTSDHGEEFWEHGKTGHGKTLYREVVHVPLFFHASDISPRRETAVVSIADIAPTISTLLQTKSFQSTVDYPVFGRDIVGDTTKIRTVFSNLRKETKKGNSSRLDAATEQEWKLIVSADTTGETERVKRRELFNVTSDEDEKQNQFKAHRQVGKELEQKIAQKLSADPPVQRELVPFDHE